MRTHCKNCLLYTWQFVLYNGTWLFRLDVVKQQTEWNFRKYRQIWLIFVQYHLLVRNAMLNLSSITSHINKHNQCLQAYYTNWHEKCTDQRCVDRARMPKYVNKSEPTGALQLRKYRLLLSEGCHAIHIHWHSQVIQSDTPTWYKKINSQTWYMPAAKLAFSCNSLCWWRLQQSSI